ncbi:hypothetical protein RHS01_02093 [Rhizoctonia solani]|uniref:Tyrosine-protein kinase ephrin type A/B receptor-like domain-containing protein n=1 Tax=Rhizoctonia solani TaxID=456999 RepID=A0A8H7IID5_9AGAM|nr:hypothetical protein RHS01_02093 [Rhizoctonia solani]
MEERKQRSCTLVIAPVKGKSVPVFFPTPSASVSGFGPPSDLLSSSLRSFQPNSAVMRFLSIAALAGLVTTSVYAHTIDIRDSQSSRLEERTFWCDAGKAWINGRCQDCSSGSFSIGGYNSQCKACPAGSTSSTCESYCVCKPGFYLNGGKTTNNACNACAPGYSSGTGASGCSPCPSNTYSTGGSTCQACPAGYTSNPASGSCQAKCQAGTYLNNGQCRPCSAGSYSEPGAASCTTCPAGTFSNTNGAGSCQTCPAGTTSNAGATSCKPVNCPAGKYSKNGSCENCPAGSYSVAPPAPMAPLLSLVHRSARPTAVPANTGAALNATPALPVSTPRLVLPSALTVLMIPTLLPVLAPALSALPAKDADLVRPASTSALTSAPTARSTPTDAAKTAPLVLTRTTTCARTALLVPSPTPDPTSALPALEAPSPHLTARLAPLARAILSPTAITAPLARLVLPPTPVPALAVLSLPGALSLFLAFPALPGSRNARSMLDGAAMSVLIPCSLSTLVVDARPLKAKKAMVPLVAIAPKSPTLTRSGALKVLARSSLAALVMNPRMVTASRRLFTLAKILPHTSRAKRSIFSRHDTF